MTVIADQRATVMGGGRRIPSDEEGKRRSPSGGARSGSGYCTGEREARHREVEENPPGGKFATGMTVA